LPLPNRDIHVIVRPSRSPIGGEGCAAGPS
jgi:hypothetical protein